MLYDVKLTLIEELLGTASADPKVYEDFIARKAPPENGTTAQEVESLPSVEEQVKIGTTVFHRLDGKPALYDYQIKGFLKDACASLSRADGTESKKLKAYKRVIDGTVFVEPRMFAAELPAGTEIGHCVRPLRAQTAQGERVALARSESLPAGTVLRFRVILLKAAVKDVMIEWLEYGRLRGLGQWRNSGKGRFTYTCTAVESETVAK